MKNFQGHDQRQHQHQQQQHPRQIKKKFCLKGASNGGDDSSTTLNKKNAVLSAGVLWRNPVILAPVIVMFSFMTEFSGGIGPDIERMTTLANLESLTGAALPFPAAVKPTVEDDDTDSSVAIFYNVFLPPNAEDSDRETIMNDIFATQIKILGESYAVQSANNQTGDDDGSNSKKIKLYYNKIGYPVNDTWMTDTCANHNIEAVPMKYYEKAMEEVTLNSIQEYCTGHPHHDVIYVHPKGSFHSRPSQKYWRKEGTMVASSEACTIQMASGECNACGARFSTMPPHFSGNFWRADCNYIKDLRPIVGIEAKFREAYNTSRNAGMTFKTSHAKDPFLGLNRYAPEQWIGSHPSFNPCSNKKIRFKPFRRDAWNEMKNDISARRKDYFLLPGLLWKYSTVYNDTAFPPDDSWIWETFPDGKDYRDTIDSLRSLKGAVLQMMYQTKSFVETTDRTTTISETVGSESKNLSPPGGNVSKTL
mmetsp:Transcript_57098/g.139126  ORF Transcript_57098/g.139126 Transcript_57098/m.139126 type:complete len:477 (-) Transcript_57098:784-2214(-)